MRGIRNGFTMADFPIGEALDAFRPPQKELDQSDPFDPAAVIASIRQHLAFIDSRLTCVEGEEVDAGKSGAFRSMLIQIDGWTLCKVDVVTRISLSETLEPSLGQIFPFGGSAFDLQSRIREALFWRLRE